MPDNSTRYKRVEEAIEKGLLGKAFDDYVYGVSNAPAAPDKDPPVSLPEEPKASTKKAKAKVVKADTRKKTPRKVVASTRIKRPVHKPILSKKEVEEARKKRLIKMRRQRP